MAVIRIDVGPLDTTNPGRLVWGVYDTDDDYGEGIYTAIVQDDSLPGDGIVTVEFKKPWPGVPTMLRIIAHEIERLDTAPPLRPQARTSYLGMPEMNR